MIPKRVAEGEALKTKETFVREREPNYPFNSKLQPCRTDGEAEKSKSINTNSRTNLKLNSLCLPMIAQVSSLLFLSLLFSLAFGAVSFDRLFPGSCSRCFEFFIFFLSWWIWCRFWIWVSLVVVWLLWNVGKEKKYEF